MNSLRRPFLLLVMCLGSSALVWAGTILTRLGYLDADNTAALKDLVCSINVAGGQGDPLPDANIFADLNQGCVVNAAEADQLAEIRLVFAEAVNAQVCQQIGGEWQVEEHTTITYNIGGQISTTQNEGTGPLTIEQNDCQIHFESHAVNPLDGSIIRLSRDGSVAGNNVTYTGEAGVIILGASYSENYITGTGVINGNTITVSNVGSVKASVQGISVVVTISGTALFTRTGSALSLTGEVRLESAAGEPAPDVTMMLIDNGTDLQQSVTDSAGHYAFTGLQAGSYTVTPHKAGFFFEPANQTISISRDTRLPAFVALPIPSLRIVRIWSDQLPGVEANFLPQQDPANPRTPGAGIVGNDKNYILMGSREDGKGYVKAEFELDPPDSTLREKVVLRLARANDANRVPIGELSALSENVAPLEVDLNDFPAPADALSGYVVTGWIDLNENGSFDVGAGEVLVEPDPTAIVIIVPPAHYNVALFTLKSGAFISPLVLPIAADFLHAFVTGDDPATASGSTTSTVCADGELDFNVGSRFGAGGCGFVYEYQFEGSGNKVIRALLASRALHEAVAVTLGLHRQDIEAEFASNREETQVVRPLVGNEKIGSYTASDLLIFGDTDPDLGLSFHVATLTNAFLTVTRGVPNTVGVRGDLIDLYDWNYEIGGFDRMAAAVQAGFPTLGDGGRVFRLRATFDGVVGGIMVDGTPFLAIGPSAVSSGLVLTVSGAEGSRILFENSTDLNVWAPFKEIVLTNIFEDTELPVSVSNEGQFFRVSLVNP